MRKTFPTFFKIARWWRDSLTLAGRAVLLGMLLGLPGVYQGDAQLTALFAGLTALLAVALVAGRWLRPKHRVRSTAPGLAMVGQEIEIECVISNASRIPAFDLEVDIAPNAHWVSTGTPFVIPALAAQETASGCLSVCSTNRGVFTLPPIRIATSFPFQLQINRAIRPTDREVCIHPRIVDLHDFDLEQLLSRHLGDAMETSSRFGGSEEYVANREYVPGMPVRRWDYASWARLNQPIVREYGQFEPRRISILVDTFRERGDSREDFEMLLSAAASIVAQLENTGWLLDTFVTGDALMHAQGEDGLSRSDAMDALARAEPQPLRPLGTLADDLGKRTSESNILLVIEDERTLIPAPFWEQLLSTSVVRLKAQEIMNTSQVSEFIAAKRS